jgi:hypothetical protein
MPSRRQVHPTANNGSAKVMGRQARDRPPKGVIDRLKRLFEKGSGIIRRQKATKIQNFAVIILLYRYGLRPSLAFQATSNCGIAPGAAIAPPLRLLGLDLPPGSYPNYLDNRIHLRSKCSKNVSNLMNSKIPGQWLQ